MKKILSLFLCLITCFSLAISPAMACDYEPLGERKMEEGYVYGGFNENVPSMLNSRASVTNLSDGSVDVSVTVLADSILNYNGTYKTNSGKIKIKLKGDLNVTIKVSIYDGDGARVFVESKALGSLKKTWTYNGAIASETYTISFENVDQRDVKLTGTISD